MGAQSVPRPITVEEYERIPDPPGGRYELHHGDLVFVTYPTLRHKDLQRRLRKILEPMAEPLGFLVDTEYPYRPLPENEVWGADVACVKLDRHLAESKWLIGSPELVIEVKSPSNTKAELQNKAMTTLAGFGSTEFWIVDPKTRTVSVYTKGGIYVYGADVAVPVPLSEGRIFVGAIFADCK